MKKKWALLFYLILTMGFLNHCFSQNDSLVLKRVKIIPDTVISGVRGVGISYVTNLTYDTLYHKNKQPTSLYLIFSIASNGKDVGCYNSTTKYCKNSFFSYRKSISFSNKETILLPFYEMKLAEGAQMIDVSISAMMSDTSIFESTLKPLRLVGVVNHQVSFVKPPLEHFNVLVSGVKMLETDFKGKQWDYNLMSGSPPDICWKVTIGTGESFNVFHRSSVMKNSYSAAWLDWAEDVVISQGDHFCISVYDDDPMNDDFAGSICGNLAQIIDISIKKQPLKFDRLSYFTFMINKIN